MERRRLALVLSLFLCLVLVATVAVAQERTGSIVGAVTDSTGAAVPDAKILVTGGALPRGIETASDGTGRYVLANLPIGTYTVAVTKTGFSTLRQVNLEVTLGSQITYNAKLQVGQITETVDVIAAAAAIEVGSSRTSTNITSNVFNDLPKGRNFGSILGMAPGVRAEVKGGTAGIGGIQVDGASGLENAYVIDGVDVTDVIAGSLRQANAVPLEFLSEVQIKSGGFEAEYGGATGGVVNVATKSGSNAFHGEGIFLFTNDKLNLADKPYYQQHPPGCGPLGLFTNPKKTSTACSTPGSPSAAR